MALTLRQLEYVVAVADTGRFGLAAERLHVSQPSLSAQVSQCESDLGFRLFHRGRSGTQPTARGRDVVRRARVILREVEDLSALGREGLFGGRLRLGVLPSLGPYLLPNVVRILHRDHPQLRLVLRDENAMVLEEGLISGRLDMIISTPQDHLGSTQIPLFSERLFAAFALDDPLACVQGPVTLTDLHKRIFLTLDRNHRLSRIVRDLARRCGGSVSGDYEGGSLDAIRLMAATGAGIAILPHIYTVTEAMRGGDIALRELAVDGAARELALIQSASHEAREGTQVLAKVLKDEAARLMG